MNNKLSVRTWTCNSLMSFTQRGSVISRVEIISHDVEHLLQALVWEPDLGPRRPQMPLAALAQQCQLQQMLQHSPSSCMTGCGPQRAEQRTWQPTMLFCVSHGCRLMLMTGGGCPEAGRAVTVTCLAQGWQSWLAHTLVCKLQTVCSLGAACMAALSGPVQAPLFATARHWDALYLCLNCHMPLQAHSALS